MATQNSVNISLSGQTGTGTFVGATSPTLVTPILGVAAATSINLGAGALSAFTPKTFYAPGFTFATVGNLSVSYANQTGYYQVVGNVLFYTFVLSFTPTFTSSSGQARITGLPTTNASAECEGSLNPISGFTYTGSNTFASLVSSVGTTNIVIFLAGAGGTPGIATTANFTTATSTQLSGSGFYFI